MLSEVSREDSPPNLLQLLGSADHPGVLGLPISIHPISASVSIRHFVCAQMFRAHLNPIWPLSWLNFICKILLPKRSHCRFHVDMNLGGNVIQPSSPQVFDYPSPHLDFSSYLPGPGVLESPKFLVDVSSGCHKHTTFNPWVYQMVYKWGTGLG